MKLRDVLKQNNFSFESIEKILSSGITNLYPPQEASIKKGVLKGKNLLMSVPTAAGKTLIAELCMIKSILNNNGRCLYIVPLKALASEKYKDFKNKYSSLGINVGITIGDLDTPKKNLNKYQIVIATAEKVDSLLRSKAKWLIDYLSVVVLDEIHFINDGERGPTLEILTARIRQLNPQIQTLALSATVSNAKEMASWLDAELVLTDWRPIPLKEGIYYNEKIIFDKYGVKIISEEPPDDVSKLTLDTLRGKGQVLIFVNSRRSAQAVSRQICKNVAKVLTPGEKKELAIISKKIAGNKTSSTKICRSLADVVLHGSAFHHAGLKPQQRELVEESFKKNLIKAISCTPTLAAGVNLPARRAIIRDYKRFETGLGAAFIPTSEYKQCAGRAGRPQYDDFGEAVLIAKSNSELSTLFERYINAKTEPIISKLDNESALRMHVLASIAGGYVHDVNSMFDFISHTFLYHQNKSANMLNVITDIFEFLHKEKFIEKSGYRFFATTFGNLTSRLYIDPLSSIIIRDGLNLINLKNTFPSIGMIHLICCCPDTPLLMNIGKKIVEDLEKFASYYHDDFILNPDNCEELDDFFNYLRTIKTTWLISQWIDEEKEDIMCNQFNVGPGDIYRHVDAMQRLLFAAESIADLFRKKKLAFSIENLKNRVRYGIKEELLDIIQIKGVGRVRARNLYKKGYKNIKDLKYISKEDLSKISQIGKILAEDILVQLKELK